MRPVSAGATDVPRAESSTSPRLERMPIVIAPDVIHDLIAARGERGQEAAMLFDAIVADVEARRG
jgi:hypothetical protein